mgnify:CR=1 FL=1
MNINRLLEVPTSSIIIGNRAREDYGDIETLKDDIEEHGLIQPIAIFDSVAPWFKDDPKHEGKQYTLIAGGRRLLACLQLGLPNIHVRMFSGEITEHRLKVLELSENINRKNFEWDEEIALKKKIHLLHVEMYGEKITTKQGEPEEVGWSQKDTAQFLNASPSGISQDLLLADALETIPELKKAKNKKEAKVMLNKIQDDILTKELQKRFETGEAVTTRSDSQAKENLLNSYIIGDSNQRMSMLDAEMADIIMADPPYAIDLASVKVEDKTVDVKVKGPEEYKKFMKPTIDNAYRVLKSDGWLILWFGIQWVAETKELLVEAGFDVGPVPFGYWMKNNGRSLFPDRYLANRVDSFFYARKGGATIENVNHNVFSYPVTSSTRFHKTEKPVALEIDILNTFARANQLLVIPYLGSGNSLVAAHKLGIQAFGFEIEEKFKSRYMYNLYGNGILDLNEKKVKELEKEFEDGDNKKTK